MGQAMTVMLIASFGAAVQELVTWYNIRNQLESAEYQRLIHSSGYWAITALMVLVAGIGTALWFHGEKHSFRDYLLLGAGFPLVLKKGISALMGGSAMKLGKPSGPNAGLLRSYFHTN